MKYVFAGEPVNSYLDRIDVPTKTKIILRGEEIALNGLTAIQDKERFKVVQKKFEEEFPVYHSLAVLATFLDLVDDGRKEINYSSKGRHIPEKRGPPQKMGNLPILRPVNSWSVSIVLPRKEHAEKYSDDKWFNYTARFKKEDDEGENSLPLLKICRWYAYDDAAEGYTPHTDREYLLQLHKSSEGDFLGERTQILEEILNGLKDYSPIVSGGRTAYNHTDNKGFYTLEEITKEPEVKEAVITLVKTHPSWKDKPLSLFGV